MSDFGDPYWSGGYSDTPSGGAGPSAEDLIWQMSPSQGAFVDPFQLDTTDPEIIKLLRQQAIVSGGESALGGIGPNAQELPGVSTSPNFLRSLLDRLKGTGRRAANFATSDRGLLTLLGALAAARDRQRPSGGGFGAAYAGARPLQRQMVQGRYGPIARYAADGGIMHAYANGGKVQMEDGGFVMTKRAVDGAGGPQGIAQLVPGARMIGGPPDPTGRRDLTPAVINGPHGQTPARVSRGEAYIPKQAVASNGGAKAMYGLMNSLQRRA